MLPLKRTHKTKRNQLQLQLSSRYAEVSTARDRFISETDGTGGSRKIGLKDIAQAKERAYQQLDANYKTLEMSCNLRS